MATTLEERTSLTEQAQEGNPWPFVERFFFIRNKSNDLVPFRVTATGDLLRRRWGHYLYLVKARQCHASSHLLAAATAMCLCIPYFQAAVVAHEREATERLFKTVQRFLEHLDPGLGVEIGHDRDGYIDFKGSGSSIYVGTAGGRKFGRSETINFLLLSEMAHYSEADAQGIWTGAPEAVPKGGWVMVESTPNGIGNLFHQQYVAAQEGKTRYTPLFIPWHANPEFSLRPEDPESLVGDRGPLDYSEAEAGLAAKYGLSEQQVRWRRSKVAEKGELFSQEYPEDDVTCWLSSQRSVFDYDILRGMLNLCRPPVATEENGAVQVWKRPQAGVKYVAFLDTGGGGKGGDPTCLKIAQARSGEEVAQMWGSFTPDEAARKAVELCVRYNDALLGVERNNTGQLALDVAWKRCSYRNLYKWNPPGAIKSLVAGTLGWPTTEASKTRMIEDFRDALKAWDYTSYDVQTIRELTEFRRRDDGSYGAPVGLHDDRVIAAMGCHQMRLAVGQEGAAVRKARVMHYVEAGAVW